MKKYILFFLLIFMFMSLSADVFSAKKAVLLSAISPGMGQLYTKSYTKAAVFFLTDVSIWFSIGRLNYEEDLAIDKYKTYALNVGGVEAVPSNEYYQTIQKYQSSDEYNMNVERYARDLYLIMNNDPVGYENYLSANLVPEEYTWNWKNSKNFKKYQDLRREKQDLEIYSNFAVAAVVINRVISMIDAARSTRKINLKMRNKSFGKLKIQPDWAKVGMKVSYEYKF